MDLVPIVERREIKREFNLLRVRMTPGSRTFNRIIGYPGGSQEARIRWHPGEQFWFYYDTSGLRNRLWCCYGIQDPTQHDELDITVEINPVKQGLDRRIRGAFLKNAAGEVFLAHSGGVGGGRKGIGKRAFTEFYRGATRRCVRWPDGKRSALILVGSMNSPYLPLQISHYVHEVADFKKAVKKGDLKRRRASKDPSFEPEFEGTRSPYSPHGPIIGDADHGRIVNSLALSLEALGIKFGNDRSRDLFTTTHGGTLNVLFEVKTGIDTRDIYTGMGQLMFHGIANKSRPRLVLVIPGTPDRATRKVLARLGIEVLPYARLGGKLVFRGLPQLLG